MAGKQKKKEKRESSAEVGCLMKRNRDGNGTKRSYWKSKWIEFDSKRNVSVYVHDIRDYLRIRKSIIGNLDLNFIYVGFGGLYNKL